MGIFHPTSTAMTVDLSRPENRKAAFSLLYLGHNIGFAVGPLLRDCCTIPGADWLFSGDAITTVISLSLIVLLVKETKPSDTRMQESLDEDNSDVAELERAEQGTVFSVFARPPRASYLHTAW